MKADLETTIGGTKYIIKPMKTSVGSRTLLRLAAICLPHAQVLTIFELKTTLIDLLDKPIEADEALKKIAANVDPESYAGIIETVFEPIYVVRGDGSKPNDGMVSLMSVYEAQFAGKYDELYQVFFAALKHNYESFFEGLPDVVASILPLKKKEPSPTTTPAPSTTTS